MPEPITVLGIGNPMMGDDGVGLEILEQLRTYYTDQQHLEFVDGGTSGMELLPTIQDAESLLVLDALAPTAHSNPGDVVTLIGDQIPRLLNSKLSPHQVGLLDLLSAARLLGTEPLRVAVVGVVAESTELHVGLTPTVTRALPGAVAEARTLLDEWLCHSTSM